MSCALPEGQGKTLIFVDVDGVLNVGVRDGSKPPLLLREKDIALAQSLADSGIRGDDGRSIERLNDVASRDIGHGEDSGRNYTQFVSSASGLSDVLTSRLADLIHFAGLQRGEVQVVLSSSWRRPDHLPRRKALEQRLSELLMQPFRFHAQTDLRKEKMPADRLRIIGDFLQEYCVGRGSDSPLRVLILEDFFVNALDGWLCDRQPIDSAEAAERYLECRARASTPVLPLDGDAVTVKLVHTFAQWRTQSGLEVQVGVGLTLDHLHSAMRFITGGSTSSRGLLALDSVRSASSKEGSPSKERRSKLPSVKFERPPESSGPAYQMARKAEIVTAVPVPHAARAPKTVHGLHITGVPPDLPEPSVADRSSGPGRGLSVNRFFC
ncbi:unnamed protein product [Polarella glacialis]|uniref:Uncharacterized protein n=1 Tax=Polarella glacialis TaxID=89957 RepID=A0A813JVV2_POLGL|nr:unnamed protein product [Polarella glacialis]CAE8684089.1 unnamed protein product [Polarella glacialis]